jgi:hypothetical protein
MDYSMLKEIEPNLGPSTSFGFRLSSTPLKDYVNPGVGQISRIYSLFVPIHSNSSPHLIEKVNDVTDQEGEGEGNVMDEDEGELIPHKESESDLEMNEEFNQNEKKRKNIDNGVIESFLHPKRIKIGEIIMPKKEKNYLKKEHKSPQKKFPAKDVQPKILHKFKIV